MTEIDNSVCAILSRADELLATPEAWTKGSRARNEHGVRCASSRDGGKPACRCVAGAIWDGILPTGDSYTDTKSYEAARRVAGDATRAKVGFSISLSTYNDSHSTSFNDIKDVLKRAKTAEGC